MQNGVFCKDRMFASCIECVLQEYQPGLYWIQTFIERPLQMTWVIWSLKLNGLIRHPQLSMIQPAHRQRTQEWMKVFHKNNTRSSSRLVLGKRRNPIKGDRLFSWLEINSIPIITIFRLINVAKMGTGTEELGNRQASNDHNWVFISYPTVISCSILFEVTTPSLGIQHTILSSNTTNLCGICVSVAKWKSCYECIWNFWTRK